MPLLRVRTFLSLIACCSAIVAADAQTPTPAPPRSAGRVIGIYDERTGSPIDSAEVRDLATNSFALTTSTGTLSLFFVDTAGALVRIRKLGYAPVTMFVENSPGSPPLTITLEPLGQMLPKVVTVDSAPNYTSAALKGFEERRKSKIGQFIPEQVVRKNEDRTLGNIIKANFRGVDVREVRDRSRWITIAATMRDGKACPVDIYLDGIPVSVNSTAGAGGAIVRGTAPRNTPATNDLSEFLTKQIAAIEFHTTATAPPQFNRTSSGCGVLLLWTRER